MKTPILQTVAVTAGLILARGLTSTQAGDFVVSGVSPDFWPRPDAEVGVAGFVIEDFEDVTLAPGLRIGCESAAASTIPSATLPNLFDPNSDPFGDAFHGGVWDGSHGLVTTADNQSHAYAQPENWGNLLLQFDPPLVAVGFSLQQANQEVHLFVNETELGALSALTGLSFTGARNGYVTIWAKPGTTISSVKLGNTGGDGFLLDHLAFLPAASGSNFVLTGFAPSTWPADDAQVGVSGFTVETFEGLDLVAGLKVGCESVAGTNAPATTLPTLFDPMDDTFGNVFSGGTWDGTHGVINTRDNQSHDYQAVENWGTMILQFAPPTSSVGFSLEQTEMEIYLVINGVGRGPLCRWTGLPINPSRQGYARIDSADDQLIGELRLVNGKMSFNDGILIDHLAFFSGPRIVSVNQAGADLQISFVSQASHRYALQSRDEVDQGLWTTLPETTTDGTGGLLQIVVANAFTEPRQFFRVAQLD